MQPLLHVAPVAIIITPKIISHFSEICELLAFILIQRSYLLRGSSFSKSFCLVRHVRNALVRRVHSCWKLLRDATSPTLSSRFLLPHFHNSYCRATILRAHSCHYSWRVNPFNQDVFHTIRTIRRTQRNTTRFSWKQGKVLV
jgi:hypothetical protein